MSGKKERQATMQNINTALPLFFLLLGLASSASAETCPDAEDIAPCKCNQDDKYDEIDVSCVVEDLNVKKLKESLKGLVGKENVDLLVGNFRIGKLPSDIFEGIGITKLELSHCDLDSLTDGGPALKGLEDTLKVLDIYECFTEDNAPASLNLGHLRQLKYLTLFWNTIKEIDNDWFEEGPLGLEFLMISNNGVEKLGDRAFENLNNLKLLSFDGNKVSALKRSMFPSAPNELEELELENNTLTSLPEDMFLNMPSLKLISLKGNGLSRLEERTWFPVWQTQNAVVIDLEGNPIQCGSHMDWIVKFPETKDIRGKCYSPISDFIEYKRKQ